MRIRIIIILCVILYYVLSYPGQWGWDQGEAYVFRKRVGKSCGQMLSRSRYDERETIPMYAPRARCALGYPAWYMPTYRYTKYRVVLVELYSTSTYSRALHI